MKKVLLSTALSLAALPAAAQVSWYAGAAGGQARSDTEMIANRETTFQNLLGVVTPYDDTDTAWKVFGGVRLNRVIAVELTYADLGKRSTDSLVYGGNPADFGHFIVRHKISGYGVDVVGTAPLGFDRFELFGKLGLFATRLEASAETSGIAVFAGGNGERTRSITRNETNLHLGLGAQYWVTRNIAIRAEYEHYDSIGKPFALGGQGTTGEADLRVASLGVLARF